MLLLAVHRTFRKTGKKVNITKSKILFISTQVFQLILQCFFFSYSEVSNTFYFAVLFYFQVELL